MSDISESYVQQALGLFDSLPQPGDLSVSMSSESQFKDEDSDTLTQYTAEYQSDCSLDLSASPAENSPKFFIDCAVCGDKSSGKHYGIYTCEGCKSFFKRSVRRNLTYACRGVRNCSVELHNRNQCQYCRLTKCLKVGMRKEAVQKGRIPASQPNNKYVPFTEQNGCQSLNYITLLLRADTMARHQQSISMPFNLTDFENTPELAAQLLVSAVDLAKNVPFFSEFSMVDQSILLRSCWSELFILNAAQHYSSFYNTSPLLSGMQNNTGFQNSTVFTFDNQNSNMTFFKEQVEKLTALQLDPVEFACLKAIVLFNPDAQGISNSIQVEAIQERTQSALQDYIRNQYSHQNTRFGKLLLRLPALRQMSANIIEELFFSQLGMVCKVEVLVNEMLFSSIGNPFVNNWAPIPNGNNMEYVNVMSQM